MRIFALFFSLFTLSCAPSMYDMVEITVAHDPTHIRSVDIEVIDINNHATGGARAAGYSLLDSEHPHLAYEFWTPVISTPMIIQVIVREVSSSGNPFCFIDNNGFLQFDLPEGYELTEYTEEIQGYERCRWDIDLAP
jgi:hypothetical protein